MIEIDRTVYDYYGHYSFPLDKLLWHFGFHNVLAARQAHQLF
jgi:hypothetical protein